MKHRNQLETFVKHPKTSKLANYSKSKGELKLKVIG